MSLYVEQLEHFFKLGTVAVVKDMMTYIMVCTWHDDDIVKTVIIEMQGQKVNKNVIYIKDCKTLRTFST
jgi:hypothetical protein